MLFINVYFRHNILSWQNILCQIDGKPNFIFFIYINEANSYMDIISSHTTAGTGNIGIHTIIKTKQNKS